MALSLSPLPPGFIVPCLPTPSVECKTGPAWVHEIKHDGYRLTLAGIARRFDLLVVTSRSRISLHRAACSYKPRCSNRADPCSLFPTFKRLV
jgi:hypothetical protein